jgi:glycosyltransferase involved in cell wall biosynthesis
MNVAFLGRSGLFEDPGGDTVQVNKTKEWLQKKYNIDIDVYTDYRDIIVSKKHYNILHIFGITDVCEYLPIFKRNYIKNFGKIFVSPIYVDYHEFDIKARPGIWKYVFFLLGKYRSEYFKNILKKFFSNKHVCLKYLLFGHKKSVRIVVNNSDFLLPNSNSEISRLIKDYSVVCKFNVIPNGVDTTTISDNSYHDDMNRFRDSILCVGRIEGRKGQLNLINAISGKPYKVFIIGKPAVNQKNYYKRCLEKAENNVEFIDYMEQSKLFHAFKLARVHVLPSWFETTGLVSLEALYFGCSIVITELGDTYDYFKDKAIYCDPSNCESILQSIEAAFSLTNTIKYQEYCKENFTWEIASDRTYNAYLDRCFY